MIKRFATFATPVLESTAVRRTRRNHGLEHATIHLLSRRVQGLKMSGRSDVTGFVLLGDAPTDVIEKAVHDALERMRGGEHKLAIHPNCGTNLVTTGTLTTLAAMAGLGARADRRAMGDRFSLALVMVMGALLVSPPIGMSLQEHITTKGDPGDLEIVSVTRREMRLPFLSKPMTVHRVNTQAG